jgi:uncharacterized coiled-coil DUF342 family protein
MRLDRKRLKCEKLELLNQTRDLYKIIESKENEIRDILKNYEYKTRETSYAVKQLIDSRGELEREKNKLELRVVDLLEQRNELSLLLESKSATVNKLQKQLSSNDNNNNNNKSNTNSPRNSFGKEESDCGYSSSSTKSRDTLSIETITNKTKQQQSARPWQLLTIQCWHP